MKKSVIIILLSATVFTSCKNKVKKQVTITNATEPVIEHVADIKSATWLKDIQLNNGAKWEANLETTQGVEKMQELLKIKTIATIEEYHQLASNLNEVKNSVVKECTMKGASHDNLHIWLYPLIEKIGALSETNNLWEASKIKQSISENIEFYFAYFK